MAPQFVKPYVKSNKNDSRDAEAIAEAMTRPTMRFVPTKEVDQQDLQALHRVRERLIGARTALVNEVHGLLHEYGIVIPKGVAKFRQAVVGKLESERDKLTPLSQEMFWKLIDEFAALEKQLAYYQEKLEALATTHPECQRLMTMPGIGPLSATALVAAVSNASAFKNDRQCAAWLGLVPRQYTTGGKERLLGISKRGDTLSAQAPGPWSTGDDPLGGAQDGPTQPVDSATARTPWQQPHGRSGGKQKCPDCLGALDESPGLSAGHELRSNSYMYAVAAHGSLARI